MILEAGYIARTSLLQQQVSTQVSFSPRCWRGSYALCRSNLDNTRISGLAGTTQSFTLSAIKCGSVGLFCQGITQPQIMDGPPFITFVTRQPGAPTNYFGRPRRGTWELTEVDTEPKSPTKMAYENHVYLAKLAEQAERYEGTQHQSRLAESSANGILQRWWKR